MHLRVSDWCEVPSATHIDRTHHTTAPESLGSFSMPTIAPIPYHPLHHRLVWIIFWLHQFQSTIFYQFHLVDLIFFLSLVDANLNATISVFPAAGAVSMEWNVYLPVHTKIDNSESTDQGNSRSRLHPVSRCGVSAGYAGSADVSQPGLWAGEYNLWSCFLLLFLGLHWNWDETYIYA